jgi:outer membrane lipoprotein-sorting protein
MTMLTRRRAVHLAGLAAAASLLPAAQGRAALPPDKQAYVRKVEAYLNGIHTLQAKFSQVSPDGGSATGKVYIDRDKPGMRFVYDPPVKIDLIAPGDWRLVFMDGQAKQQNVLPVKDTPLGFLLNKQVSLSGDLDVTDVALERGEILITVTRTKAPDQGRVVIAFVERPLEFRRWMVTDPQGMQTVVILENVQLNKPIDQQLFVYRDPKIFGWPNS